MLDKTLPLKRNFNYSKTEKFLTLNDRTKQNSNFIMYCYRLEVVRNVIWTVNVNFQIIVTLYLRLKATLAALFQKIIFKL